MWAKRSADKSYNRKKRRISKVKKKVHFACVGSNPLWRHILRAQVNYTFAIHTVHHRYNLICAYIELCVWCGIYVPMHISDSSKYHIAGFICRDDLSRTLEIFCKHCFCCFSFDVVWKMKPVQKFWMQMKGNRIDRDINRDNSHQACVGKHLWSVNWILLSALERWRPNKRIWSCEQAFLAGICRGQMHLMCYQNANASSSQYRHFFQS